jgi:hypothetical protein
LLSIWIIILVGIGNKTAWGRHTTLGRCPTIRIITLRGLLAHVRWRRLTCTKRVIPLQSGLLRESLRWRLSREVIQTLNQVVLLKFSANFEVIYILEELCKIVRKLSIELICLMQHISYIEIASNSLIKLLIELLLALVLLG